MNPHRLLGARAESAAVVFLIGQGYRILDRNYATRLGEIDIVARHEDAVVFIEVKARKSTRRGTPREAVSASKQRKIIMVATHYIKKHGIHDTRIRFDVVAMMEERGRFLFDLIPNAFQAG